MSFATVSIGTRPDQDVALAIFVIEQAGIDGSSEAGVIQFEAKISTTFAGTLGPSCANFCTADKDTVAWSVIASCANVGDDAYAFCLDAERNDFSGVFVDAVLLESADGSHFKSPFCFRCRTMRSRWRSKGQRRLPPHPCDRSTAEDGKDWFCCFVRNVGSPTGEESKSEPLRPRQSRQQPIFGQIKPDEETV